ncbi:MAG: CRTAC1 family protein [Planctomycetes bacterium]|nr:CRTAC1 family protein [Planctomycetota bacterium]
MKFVRPGVLVLAACAACAACADEPQPAAEQAAAASASTPAAASNAPLRFVDVAAASGVTAITWCGRPEKPHLLESGGTGLALFDADRDGDLDLYLVNGWRLSGKEVAGRPGNVFYRNRGDGTFEDATASSGLADGGFGCGVEVGDVDSNGTLDVFVTNFGPDTLYLGRGDGTFERASSSPGVDGWSAGAALFDGDRDGDLDLFVAGYIQATLEEVLAAEPTLDWKDLKVMFGPFGMEGERDAYFVNDGKGHFSDATEVAGVEDVGLFYGFGVLACDLDDDLDLDLYVANDSNPNYLYENDGTGHFKDVGLWSGAALESSGRAQAGMGVAAGDVDGDGRADLMVTNFADDFSTLYLNQGNRLFRDVTAAWGVRGPTYKPLSWGVVFEDFDLDGHRDIYVANGHIYPQASLVPEQSLGYEQTNLVLLNEGQRFRDVSVEAGPGLEVKGSSRGVAAGDLDRDGDVDLVIANVDQPPTILRNESPRRGKWLVVDAPGALRVEVRCGERVFVRHQVHGGSFCSVSDRRFHFGLGDIARADEVAAVFSDGKRVTQTDVALERVIVLSR